MGRVGRLATIAGCMVLALGTVACGGDEGGGEGTTAPTGATAGTDGGGGGGGGTTLTIADFAFVPSTIEVSGPTTLTVANEDEATHTFTTDDGGVDQEIAAGETVEIEIEIGEDTGFHCAIHPSMTGTLAVA